MSGNREATRCTSNDIQFTPTCGTVWSAALASAVCPQPELGVFALSATGTGAAGTICAGTVFTIAVVHAPTGKVAFTPPAPVVLPDLGDTCTINFSFDVLAAPSVDCGPSTPGLQACPNFYINGPTDQFGFFASSSVSAADITFPDEPTPPTPGPPGPPASPVPPASSQVTATRVPGKASLEADRGCVGKKLDVKVTGRQIANVTFSIDGERRAADTSAPFKAQIKSSGLVSFGTHNLSATVDFTAASGTPDRTLKRKIVRCSPAEPKFTG